MGEWTKRDSNNNLRKQIETIIKKRPVGSIIRTEYVMKELSEHKSRDMNTKRVGVLLREREDLNKVASSQWRRIL
jgi:hypothetical protein